MSAPKLTVTEKIGYSGADAAANFVFMTMILFQTNFYTDTFGLSASVAAAILLWPKLWDAVFDPILLDEQPAEVAVAADSIFIVPDSARLDSTSGQWVPARFDTVHAWRVTQRAGGQDIVAWIDDLGRVVQAASPNGYRLERAAFELAFEPSAVCEAGQVVRKSRLFANVEIGLELEQRPGPCEQKIEIGRVSDIAQRASLIGPSQIFATPACRCLHDDGNKLRDRVGPDSLGQLVPVHARHHDVGNHKVRLIGFNGRKRLVAVGRRGYIVTGEVQRGLDQV